MVASVEQTAHLLMIDRRESTTTILSKNIASASYHVNADDFKGLECKVFMIHNEALQLDDGDYADFYGNIEFDCRIPGAAAATVDADASKQVCDQNDACISSAV